MQEKAENPNLKVSVQQRQQFLCSERYSNSNSREQFFETIFFEAEWRGKLFQMNSKNRKDSSDLGENLSESIAAQKTFI